MGKNQFLIFPTTDNQFYINLPTPVISILATPGIAETISSTGSDPPSPSSVMKFKMIATKPNAF